MSISLKSINKNLVLVFLLCKELKLKFTEVQKVYLLNDKLFWKYFQTFLPGIRLTLNRFMRLNDLALKIYNNIDNLGELEVSEFDKNIISEFEDLIQNKYYYNGVLFTLDEIKDYMKLRGDTKPYLKLILIDGRYVIITTPEQLYTYEDNIKTIIIGNKEYSKMSTYTYNEMMEEGNKQ